MKRYKEIKLADGSRAPSSTIQGIKRLLLHGKKLGEKFKCTCPNGNIHIWEIKVGSIHTTVGYAPRKKAARVGGKQSKNNYIATLKEVSHATN